MSATTADGLPVMTFGVEMEVWVFYKVVKPGENIDKMRKDPANHGLILVKEGDDEEKHWNQCVNDLIRWLQNIGCHVNGADPQDLGYSTDVHAAAQAKYLRWTVDTEIALDVYDEQQKEDDKEGIARAGLEIITPAFRHDDKNYDEITRVIDSFKEHYRYVIDFQTAVHVHVGAGAQKMPDEWVCRMACLIWVLDPIMNNLHPVIRRHRDRWCPRSRIWSNLAHGMTAAVAEDPDVRNVYQDYAAANPPTIENGLKELIKCTEATTSARLMLTNQAGACAYNFWSYIFADSRPHAPPTIEFRQAAGSMNTLWITAWAKICTRVCEYAAFEMDDDELARLALVCTSIEKEGPDSPRGQLMLTQATDAFLRSMGLDTIATYVHDTTPDSRAAGQ
ncbi:hypothetical protein JX265_005332 [Neoarthrinium moseri]|uniref:Uncharacterized protein n=1 Tax=Neoarthrinium moseri TaxID=1658444 RepID=A0A9P9WNR2_9PEZI|nr:hypothetical protein JX265_005332 [Neoarthrinium moseri]